MTFNDAVIACQRLSETLLLDADYTNDPTELGLDILSGSDFFITTEFIAIPKYTQWCIERYGDFEYVADAYKQVIGDYIFYSADDPLVLECIERYYYIGAIHATY